MRTLSQYVNERFTLNLVQGPFPVVTIFIGPTLRGPETSSGLVENIGVEPMTSCVQGRRSSQLS